MKNLKSIKLTSASTNKAEERQVKSLNTQFAGILKKELNTEWKSFSASLSQVVKFITNEGLNDFTAFCEQVGYSLPSVVDGGYIIKLYKQFGTHEVKRKGDIVAKVRFSAHDICQAVSRSMKAKK